VRALSLTNAPRRPLAGFLSLRRFLLLLGAVGAGAAFLFLLTWRGVAFLKLGQSVSELQREEAALVTERKEMELARARLMAPDRVERVARERLGMVTLSPGQQGKPGQDEARFQVIE
jgi:cell division protein FtsL